MGKKGPHRYHVTVKDAVILVIIQISVLVHDTVFALYDKPQLILTSKEILVISQYFYTQIQKEFQTEHSNSKTLPFAD